MDLGDCIDIVLHSLILKPCSFVCTAETPQDHLFPLGKKLDCITCINRARVRYTELNSVIAMNTLKLLCLTDKIF